MANSPLEYILISTVCITATVAMLLPPPSTKCPPNAEWRQCTPVCGQKSCDNLNEPHILPCMSLRCGAPSCACKEGHVYITLADKSRGCVPLDECIGIGQNTTPNILNEKSA